MKTNAIVSTNGHIDNEIDMDGNGSSIGSQRGGQKISTLVAAAEFDASGLWEKSNNEYYACVDAGGKAASDHEDADGDLKKKEKKADAYLSDRDWLKEHSRNQEEKEDDEPNVTKTLAELLEKKDDDTKFCEQFDECLKLNVHVDSMENAMIGPWTMCVDDEPNCGPLHDLISIEWGEFRDGSDELTVEMIAEMAEKKDDYKRVYEYFGKYLQLDVHEYSTNRMKVTELLRFHTTTSGDELIGLKEYADNMNEGRNDLYCITGENFAAMSFSPSFGDPEERTSDAVHNKSHR